MKQLKCEICGNPITGAQIGTGSGFAHPHCYHRENPPTPATSFYIVARGASDPALAAEVVSEMVDPDTARRIVDTFNKRLLIDWARRCEFRP